MLAITTFLFVVLVCSYAEAGYGCPRSLTQSDRTRTIFLDFHNEVRRNISLGKQPNKQGFLGPAKNMYELVCKQSSFFAGGDHSTSLLTAKSPCSYFRSNLLITR
ncbi:hypothetical protein TELCIR_15556 [Teladorsagia circumcincta]|uniref:SCP domain-containing protein n=1 Tax=Teladorsagia circumcincta TaxID=45464 RepID=A0A2G9TXX5_TELCI|nr:hypothetical protein TELCIR_15556 [Teladorsagia circumcincta]